MNSNPLSRCLPAVAAALLLTAAPARGQVGEDEGAGARYGKETYPTQSLVDQPLTLPGGMLEIGVPVVIDVSDGGVIGGPDWSIPVYLDYGLTDSVQLGVFHSTGLCLAGDENGCPEVYDDIGARLRLGLWRSAPTAQLALDVGVLAQDFDDVRTSGFVGLNYKRTTGNFALQVGAQLLSALNDRDELSFTEVLSGLALAQLQIFEGFAAYGFVGVDAPLNEDDILGVEETGVSAPVGVGAEVAPLRNAAFGAELAFPNLIGEDATADVRSLTVYARLFL